MTVEISSLSMGLAWDRSCDPWICSQTQICSQARCRLRYATQFPVLDFNVRIINLK